MNRLGQMVFIMIVIFCLAQDTFYRPPTQKELSKVHMEKRTAVTNRNKNIDDLIIGFLLR